MNGTVFLEFPYIYPMNKTKLILAKAGMIILVILTMLSYIPGIALIMVGTTIGWVKEFLIMGVKQAEFELDDFKTALHLLNLDRLQEKNKRRQEKIAERDGTAPPKNEFEETNPK